MGRVEDQHPAQPPSLARLARLEQRHPKTFAAQHQPDDAQLPILEPIDLGVRPAVKFGQRTARHQVFPASFTDRKQEGHIGHLFSQDIDGPVHPNHLLVGVGEHRPRFLATQPIHRAPETFVNGCYGRRLPPAPATEV
jgi:hypothetical protein